jgi:hypothetical protein
LGRVKLWRKKGIRKFNSKSQIGRKRQACKKRKRNKKITSYTNTQIGKERNFWRKKEVRNFGAQILKLGKGRASVKKRNKKF